jgi:hypothetical protein
VKVRRSGWRWFVAWCVAGALAFYSLLDLLGGFGLFVAPIAVVCVWWVATRTRVWPEIIGLASGLGLVLGALAWANRGYQGQCSSVFTLETGGHMSCGGAPPVPILIAGIVLILISVFAYAALPVRRADKPAAPSSWLT